MPYRIGTGASWRCPVPRCWSPHSLFVMPAPDNGYSYVDAPASMFRYTFQMLLIHFVQEHAGEKAFTALVRAGFLDGTSEAGEAFIRLDFWRSHYRRALRDQSYEWSRVKPALWGA